MLGILAKDLRWDPHLQAGGRVSITWRDVGVEDGLTFNSDERLGLTLGRKLEGLRRRKLEFIGLMDINGDYCADNMII